MDKPIYSLFAGVNGAGKSTLYSLIKNINGTNLGVRLNSDEIVQARGEDWRDNAAQIKAARELLSLRRVSLEKKVSMNQETTLSGISIVKTIEKAKELGYQIDLYYVGVKSDDIAKQRVAERVKRGGHGVSDKTLEARFVYSQENLKAIIEQCDRVSVYDNTVTMTSIMFSESGKIKELEPCEWVEKILSEYIKNHS